MTDVPAKPDLRAWAAALAVRAREQPVRSPQEHAGSQLTAAHIATARRSVAQLQATESPSAATIGPLDTLGLKRYLTRQAWRFLPFAQLRDWRRALRKRPGSRR